MDGKTEKTDPQKQADWGYEYIEKTYGDKPEETKDEPPQEIVCHGGMSLPKMGVRA
jgi:hypothetical protein